MSNHAENDSNQPQRVMVCEIDDFASAPHNMIFFGLYRNEKAARRSISRYPERKLVMAPAHIALSDVSYE